MNGPLGRIYDGLGLDGIPLEFEFGLRKGRDVYLPEKLYLRVILSQIEFIRSNYLNLTEESGIKFSRHQVFGEKDKEVKLEQIVLPQGKSDIVTGFSKSWITPKPIPFEYSVHFLENSAYLTSQFSINFDNLPWDADKLKPGLVKFENQKDAIDFIYKQFD